MRLVTFRAVLARLVNTLERKHLKSMAAQAIVVVRLHAGMRFVALVTFQPGHRRTIRKGCLCRFPVTGQAPRAIGVEHVLFFRREGMAPEAGDLLRSCSVNIPILVAAKTGRRIRPEGMHLPAVTILAIKLLHEDMPGVAR